MWQDVFVVELCDWQVVWCCWIDLVQFFDFGLGVDIVGYFYCVDFVFDCMFGFVCCWCIGVLQMVCRVWYQCYFEFFVQFVGQCGEVVGVVWIVFVVWLLEYVCFVFVYQ